MAERKGGRRRRLRRHPDGARVFVGTSQNTTMLWPARSAELERIVRNKGLKGASPTKPFMGKTTNCGENCFYTDFVLI
jgi:hypothetical protein